VEAPKKLSIYEYDNYRSFLKDFYFFEKARNKNFSFRFFSRMAGFKSPNFLKKVMEGECNLSEESIPKFAKALKLNKEETEFFRNLVLLNQARTVEEKKVHAQEILRSRVYRRIHPIAESQHNYLANWYFVVIREMVSLPDFKEDPEWISSRISPKVTPSEVRWAIEEMLKIGILKREANQELALANSFIMTGDEVLSPSAGQFHREMMKRASECIDRVPREKRELSALTVCVSRDAASKIKQMVQDFRKAVLQACAEDQSPEAVYQINLHLFPLVEAPTDPAEPGGSK
jgi:uncharacterized protein (TIGR02147 family)